MSIEPVSVQPRVCAVDVRRLVERLSRNTRVCSTCFTYRAILALSIGIRPVSWETFARVPRIDLVYDIS